MGVRRLTAAVDWGWLDGEEDRCAFVVSIAEQGLHAGDLATRDLWKVSPGWAFGEATERMDELDFDVVSVDAARAPELCGPGRAGKGRPRHDRGRVCTSHRREPGGHRRPGLADTLALWRFGSSYW